MKVTHLGTFVGPTAFSMMHVILIHSVIQSYCLTSAHAMKQKIFRANAFIPRSTGRKFLGELLKGSKIRSAMSPSF